MAYLKCIYKSGRPSPAKEYGTPTLISHYYNPDGFPTFSIIRYEKKSDNGETIKSVRPLYWGIDNKIHSGLPYESEKPILNLNEVKARPESTIIIVEGEKCQALAAQHVQDYVFVTWSLRAQVVDKTDWSTLAGCNILIWPDNDTAGLQAAQRIQSHLHQVKIISIPPDVPKGWDIADAIKSGIDPLVILREESIKIDIPQIHNKGNDLIPYIPLGYNESYYYFLLKEKKTILRIGVSKFNRSVILELGNKRQ